MGRENVPPKNFLLCAMWILFTNGELISYHLDNVTPYQSRKTISTLKCCYDRALRLGGNHI